jgi:hypothetical protein
MTAFYNVKHLIKLKYESSEKLQNARLDRKKTKIHINHNYWNAIKKLFIPRHAYVHTLVLTI